MTRETKAGLVVSCSFLCLVGVVLFSKLNERETSGTESPGEGELAKLMAEPQPVSNNNSGPAASPVVAQAETVTQQGAERQSDNRKTMDAAEVVPAEFRQGSSKPIPDPAASPKEPVLKERASLPPPTVNVASEPSAPAPVAGLAGEQPASKEEKTPVGNAPSPPPPPSAWAPLPARAEVVTPQAQESKIPGAGASLPNPVQSATTTGGTAAPAAPGVSTSEDSAGGAAKPTPPPSVAAGPGPALVPTEDATTKPPSSGAPPVTTGPSGGPNRAETAGISLDRSKTPFQLPQPPASASAVVPEKSGLTPGSVGGAAEAARSDTVSPAGPRASAGLEQKLAGSGGDFKMPRTTEAAPATSQAATPPSAPTNRFASGSSETPVHGNLGFAPRSTQEFAPRQGSTGGWPGTGSPSADRDKAFMPAPTPFQSAPTQAPLERSINGSVQLGSPAVATPQPSPTSQTPAPSISPFPPGGSSPVRPAPPLAGPVPSGPPQSSIGGILQVESYDENTHTCKANDTFRTISQEWYQTDRYERALLLFNRNTPPGVAHLARRATDLYPAQADSDQVLRGTARRFDPDHAAGRAASSTARSFRWARLGTAGKLLPRASQHFGEAAAAPGQRAALSGP